MADIVLALKPKWLELILSGKKTVECRRCLPKKLEPGDKIYLYCKGDIHGVAVVQEVERVTDFYHKRAIVNEYAHAACMHTKEIWDYLFLAASPGVILLKDVERFDDPHPWRGSTPQNFIYYRKEHSHENT